MIPKNTISITPKQLAELQQVSEYTPIWIENFEIWSCVFCRTGSLHSWNSDVRMYEHDFRHFFGEQETYYTVKEIESALDTAERKLSTYKDDQYVIQMALLTIKQELKDIR